MKLIPLLGERGKGKFTLVDDYLYLLLSQHKWYLNSSGYAITYTKNKHTRRMHSFILPSNQEKVADHINRIRLDNRLVNLRLVNKRQNAWNRSCVNKSGYKGVYYERSKRKWIARIYLHSRAKSLGTFNTVIEAAMAYNEAAKKYFGKYAHLNKV